MSLTRKQIMAAMMSAGGSIYTSLSYIKFTGAQRIHINYQTNPNTKLEIDMQFEQNSNQNSASAVNYWIGQYQNTVGSFYANFGGSANQYNQIFYWFENGYVSATWMGNYGANIYNRSTWTYANNKVTFLGVNTTTETKTKTQDGQLVLGGSGASNVFNRHNLKIYSMKISENDVLLHNLVPMTDGTNNGLYDTITNEFLTSQTSTNLVGA